MSCEPCYSFYLVFIVFVSFLVAKELTKTVKYISI